MIKSALMQIALLLAGAVALQANESASSSGAAARNIKIIGREYAVVTAAETRLGDIAEITSARLSDDEAVAALRKIALGPSPRAGKSLTIPATQVLGVMEEAGVDLNQISYSFPRVITLTRAGRKLELAEIQAVLFEALKQIGSDYDLRDVEYDRDLNVAPGEISLEASPGASAAPGLMSFNLTARAPGEEAAHFQVRAKVEQWRDLPVARRPLPRGSLIGADDVMLARLNLAALPRDVISQPSELLGYEASQEISAGEAFRRGKVAAPVAIESGSRVTLIYKSDYLEATASGVALEAAALGAKIRVRNDASRRVLVGTVLQPGIVGVKQ